MAEVAVIGEGVIDRFLESSGARDVIGGSPLNTAVALRRAGVECDWWGRMSTGAEGEALVAYAAENGVAGVGVLRVDSPATLVTIELNSQGVPAYGFHLEGASDWGWTSEELQGLSAYKVIQIGSLTSVLEPGSSALLARLRELKASATPPVITFDPNARPKAVKSVDEAQQVRSRVSEFLTIADFVKVSDEDLDWLNPGVAALDSAQIWSTVGPKLVVMTRGSEGAIAFCDGKVVASTPGVKVDVVDTVGAGDTFMAWLLRSLVEEYAANIPLDTEAVTAMLTQSAAAAAVTCSRKGCNPPRREEIL